MGEQFRNDIMLGRRMPEHRAGRRVPVCMSGMVSWRGAREQVLALVRDVSDSGVFFYANFSAGEALPDLGQELTLRFTVQREERQVEAVCRGRVVRMVRFPTGAATGFGLKLERRPDLPPLGNVG